MYFYRISTSYACFDIVCDSVWVDKAPPIAKWAVGKNGADVLTYYKHSGATIEVLVGGHWEEVP
jgi:hypothetical protein